MSLYFPAYTTLAFSDNGWVGRTAMVFQKQPFGMGNDRQTDKAQFSPFKKKQSLELGFRNVTYQVSQGKWLYPFSGKSIS